MLCSAVSVAEGMFYTYISRPYQPGAGKPFVMPGSHAKRLAYGLLDSRLSYSPAGVYHNRAALDRASLARHCREDLLWHNLTSPRCHILP